MCRNLQEAYGEGALEADDEGNRVSLNDEALGKILHFIGENEFGYESLRGNEQVMLCFYYIC